MTVIFTAGTFDIPHVGHFNFLQTIRKLNLKAEIVVALNTDKFIYKYKGVKPIFNYKERERFLNLYSKALDFKVAKGSGADSKPVILKSKANIIVIGNDWLEKDYCKQMDFDSQWLTKHNIALVYLPYTDGISSSLIKERIKNA